MNKKQIMKIYRIAVFAICLVMAACQTNDDNSAKKQVSGMPIDSSNVEGTAPARYGGDDPSKVNTDTQAVNTDDTGTRADNVHNTGYRKSLKH
jgi:hypothetical protein